VPNADGGMTWWCRMCEQRPSGSRPFDGVTTISLKIKSKFAPGGFTLLQCSGLLSTGRRCKQARH
jgi:hypothetical protein